MSRRSKNSSPKKAAKTELPLDRPFDPEILKRAYEIASQYRLVLEPNAEVGYLANSIEMPHVWGDGKTPDACVHETREALVAAIATMLENGEAPPLPASDELRNQQINVRVTSQEKRLLEEAARSRGFRGISDFVRSTTLASIQ